ncbi:MAG: GFA family protein [Pseudomonadota bacterium]
MTETQTGGCLCGAVTITAKVGNGIQACHCRQCQTWTGGSPYLCVPVSEAEVRGAETIEAYHASAWGERAFCRVCGTTVYWTMKGQPPHSVAVGLFPDQSGMSVTEEIFVDYRPPWLPPFAGAAQSTEAEENEKLHAWMAEQAILGE